MSTKLSFILLSKTRILLAIFLLSIASGSIAQSVTIGVSIPSATHGWAGGLNFHAEQSKARLEAENPDLKIVLVTANSASEQANDLEDLVAIHNIDALVILPFESAPLTGPVRNVKRRGVFVTVVDRGLSEEGIADVYVAGNNAEMGRVSAEYIKEALDNTGDIVVLRGIPTVIEALKAVWAINKALGLANPISSAAEIIIRRPINLRSSPAASILASQ